MTKSSIQLCMYGQFAPAVPARISDGPLPFPRLYAYVIVAMLLFVSCLRLPKGTGLSFLRASTEYKRDSYFVSNPLCLLDETRTIRISICSRKIPSHHPHSNVVLSTCSRSTLPPRTSMDPTLRRYTVVVSVDPEVSRIIRVFVQALRAYVFPRFASALRVSPSQPTLR